MTDSDFLAAWFCKSTAPEHQRYNDRMSVASAYRGSPRWERERTAALKEFNDATTEAQDLFDRASDELESFGETTEETNYLLDQYKVGEIMREVA